MIDKQAIKECEALIKSLNIQFDKALPIFQDKLWNIAEKYNTTGTELLKEYLEQESKK
ncbi:hypothetical protein [Inconstantimicrobium mannanitabidum]|uniref:Uncharacterized protein n=1 Tax=Inconstantimicrobium mannanitabidum TaxID=1604901 RepID=A0ACB5RAD7_9CLOT|nr:hypothetical protein [Clostridium sp. TW13]GKX66011.1 hypothetical protein rsdtw13_12690 [Clostridium sp. TW13]